LTRGFLDISRTIAPDALVYPGDPPLRMEPVSSIGPDHAYNVLALHWTTHFLTHLDAPRHFFPDGESIEDLAPERFIGEALVVEVEGSAVREQDVPENVSGLNLLFKTRNSAQWDPQAYNRDHVYLEGAAAEAIAARGANLVGLDYLSVDRFGDESYPAHRALLGAGVLILEGLDLSGVEAGRYTLYALPLKIADGDGSPVRAVLAVE
jgi:arylformamidase